VPVTSPEPTDHARRVTNPGNVCGQPSNLHPDADPETGINRVRTDLNAVRSVLREATGIEGRSKFIVYDGISGRYRIDPDLIEVDLWRMLSALDRANKAGDETASLAALREAVACYCGGFAEGHDRPGSSTTPPPTATTCWAPTPASPNSSKPTSPTRPSRPSKQPSSVIRSTRSCTSASCASTAASDEPTRYAARYGYWRTG
jgi:hypothetical protein